MDDVLVLNACIADLEQQNAKLRAERDELRAKNGQLFDLGGQLEGERQRAVADLARVTAELEAMTLERNELLAHEPGDWTDFKADLAAARADAAALRGLLEHARDECFKGFDFDNDESSELSPLELAAEIHGVLASPGPGAELLADLAKVEEALIRIENNSTPVALYAGQALAILARWRGGK